MSDEDFELHDEDLHDEAGVSDDSGVDSENGKPAKAAKSAEPKEEDAKSMTAHNEARKALEDDVAAFLARGGSIQQVDDNVMADPPRKPQSNYGSRPI
ncbi:hypothetical protein [Oceanobacter kriegii]|uniref:hypothetical protein n=1 Tax=Oceanobacter kriegii TaxID=64972 RepID=UPI00041C8F44|nr:hypothetical protein [Oceanobacter kriegii]